METQTQLNPTTATHLFDFNGVGNTELGERVSSADPYRAEPAPAGPDA